MVLVLRRVSWLADQRIDNELDNNMNILAGD